MKELIKKQIILMISSVVIGLIVGGLDTFFGKILIWLSTMRVE